MPGVINNQTVVPVGHLRPGPVFDPTSKLQWEELVGDQGPREDIVTHGDTRLTVRGYVFGHDTVLPALRYWLGWAEVNYDAPSLPLVRYVPAAHPELNSCFARQVTINGWRYLRKQPSQEPVGLPVRVPYAIYDRYLFQIEFGSVDYAVRAEASINSEWERFVTVKPSDGTELVAIPAGLYLYKSNAPAGFQGKPVTLNAPLLRHAVERTDFKVTLHNLPLDFVCNAFRVPRKLAKAKGKVNRTDFLGFPAQTFLFMKYELEVYPMPVATESWDTARFGCNVHLFGSYQEPDKAVAGETLAGWNLAPGLDARYVAGWYGVQTSDGKPMYSLMEMNNLLTHWSLNDLAVGYP